jgi:hypothetical protein
MHRISISFRAVHELFRSVLDSMSEVSTNFSMIVQIQHLPSTHAAPGLIFPFPVNSILLPGQRNKTLIAAEETIVLGDYLGDNSG